MAPGAGGSARAGVMEKEAKVVVAVVAVVAAAKAEWEALEAWAGEAGEAQAVLVAWAASEDWEAAARSGRQVSRRIALLP